MSANVEWESELQRKMIAKTLLLDNIDRIHFGISFFKVFQVDVFECGYSVAFGLRLFYQILLGELWKDNNKFPNH